MSGAQVGWTGWAGDLNGPRFAEFQRELAKYNALRFRPHLPEEAGHGDLVTEEIVARAEIEFVESLRRKVAPLADAIPADADGFIAWFEQLKNSGPRPGRSAFSVARHDGHGRTDEVVPLPGSCWRSRFRRSAGHDPDKDAGSGPPRRRTLPVAMRPRPCPR